MRTPPGGRSAVQVIRAFTFSNETLDVYVRINTKDKSKKKGRSRDPFQGVAVLPHVFRPKRDVLVFAAVGRQPRWPHVLTRPARDSRQSRPRRQGPSTSAPRI